MPRITVTTEIKAPVERVFDLARNIDVHQQSQTKHREVAIAGRTSGLIELGEEVTWEATHLGVRQKLRVRITELRKYSYFVDEMVQGAFAGFRHEHHFEFDRDRNLTRMVDHFDYRSPLGLLGKLADLLFLKKYMTTLLLERNEIIKRLAEGRE